MSMASKGEKSGGPEHASLMDHEYDGIQEFDNPTPGWWHALFLASVVFSIGYTAWYHASPLSASVWDKWRAAEVEEFARIFGEIGDLEPDQPTIVKMMGDERMMAVAQGIFQGNCAACHAKDGGGINGVNLTDDNYKNVKSLPDVFDVITRGAANGAMPAWENMISKNERVILAAYVARLRGTEPAAARPAEGDVIPAWPTE
jgi:cytochrome c oxidase cbb3-type subunit 3